MIRALRHLNGLSVDGQDLLVKCSAATQQYADEYLARKVVTRSVLPTPKKCREAPVNLRLCRRVPADMFTCCSIRCQSKYSRLGAAIVRLACGSVLHARGGHAGVLPACSILALLVWTREIREDPWSARNIGFDRCTTGVGQGCQPCDALRSEQHRGRDPITSKLVLGPFCRGRYRRMDSKCSPCRSTSGGGRGAQGSGRPSDNAHAIDGARGWVRFKSRRAVLPL